MSLAARKGYPLVVLGDANGGRLPDLLGSDFAAPPAATRASTSSASASPVDRIPRVTAILGNAYGDPALWAGTSDFVVMAEGCSIALSGPSLVGSSHRRRDDPRRPRRAGDVGAHHRRGQPAGATEADAFAAIQALPRPTFRPTRP